MINIDMYAYNSKLKRVSPIRKLLFALLALSICIWADSIAISVSMALIMIGVAYKRVRYLYELF